MYIYICIYKYMYVDMCLCIICFLVCVYVYISSSSSSSAVSIDFPDSLSFSLTFFRHSSLSFIASVGLLMYILWVYRAVGDLVGQQTLACPYFSNTIPHLVHFIWMGLEIGGLLPYNCCFVGCCLQDLFNIARSILEQFLSSFFCICLVSIHIVELTQLLLGRNCIFILSDDSDFNMIYNLLIVVHALVCCILMSFSVDEILLLRDITHPLISENHLLEWRCLLFD